MPERTDDEKRHVDTYVCPECGKLLIDSQATFFDSHAVLRTRPDRSRINLDSKNMVAICRSMSDMRDIIVLENHNNR